MKITDMVHQTVVAFEPRKHPCYALMALAMMLVALVALADAGASGAALIFRAIW